MARSGARPERSLRTMRDAALLLFVAAALIAGLVHYGVLISQDDPATSSSGPVATASSAQSSTPPTGRAASGEPSPAPATAGSDSVAATAGPSSSPTTSGAPPPPQPTGADSSPTSGDSSLSPTAASSEAATTTTTTTTSTDDDVPATCWDGRTATRLNKCGSPSGEEGLRWVFPSLARTDVSCHPAPRPSGAYETVVGLECFGRVDGHPFSVTYEQVTSRAAAQAAIDRSYADGSSYDFPGARGGRCTWFDPNAEPARVSGYYKGFPFVVSVFAPSPQVVKKAWAQQVVLRPAGAIRGLRAGASGAAGSVN